MIEMIALPYSFNDLEPYISAKTLEYHYGKHYKNYVDTLNKLIAGTEFENMTLEEIIGAVYGKPEYQTIFNNAGQVFNHNMYWKSVGIGEKFDTNMRQEIIDTFGSLEDFREKLVNEGVKVFSSNNF